MHWRLEVTFICQSTELVIYASTIIMNVLVCLAMLVVVVASEPQSPIWPWGAYPVTQVVVREQPLLNQEQMRAYVGLPLSLSGLFQMPKIISIPSQDVSRGLKQPVEDTPEVKHARKLFAEEYEKAYETAAIAAAMSPEMKTRRRRDVFAQPWGTPAHTSLLMRSGVQHPLNAVPYHNGPAVWPNHVYPATPYYPHQVGAPNYVY